MELDLKSILYPVKVLEFGKIKIHLEGIDPIQEHYIEAIKFRPYPSQPERDKAMAIYIQRLICSTVKKVEGVTVNGAAWDVSFIDDTKKEIDLTSYNVLNKVFNKLSKEIDFASLIISFYNTNKDSMPDGIEFEKEEDKKKD